MERTLKVAYILHRFPYLTETFIMREIYRMRKQGVDAEIFSLLSPQHSLVHGQAKELLPFTHYSPFLSWDVIGAQVHFIRRCPRRYLKALGNVIRQTFREPWVMLRSLLLFPKSLYFARLIEEKNINHIHAHFVWIDGIAAGVASDLLGITFTIHPHAFGLFGRNQKAVRTELENATQIVTISNFNRSYIRQLCPNIDPDHIHVVYCGLETDRLRPVENPSAVGPLQILSVGRLIEKKGFEYLVEACSVLAKRGSSFRCRIVGDGPRKESLQAAIDRHGLHDHVKLVGAMSQNQVVELYQRSDIFALPCVVARNGDRDGIPVVLMEAMACELPVVTTSVAGIPDLVKDDVTGLLVKHREAASLADALERLIDDKSLRCRLGKQGRQLILQKFDVEKNVMQLASIFRQVSNTNHAGLSEADLMQQTCASSTN